MSWFSKGPFIKVNNSTIFSKTEMRPIEFGQNAVEHGFKFGMGSYADYMAQSSQSISDQSLQKLVSRNPGFLQLLYSNLYSGAYYGFLKLALKADESVLASTVEGIKVQLRLKMAPVDEHAIENHKLIVIQFGDAIIDEVTDKAIDTSVSAFIHYALSFYVPTLSANSNFDPIDCRLRVFTISASTVDCG